PRATVRRPRSGARSSPEPGGEDMRLLGAAATFVVLGVLGAAGTVETADEKAWTAQDLSERALLQPDPYPGFRYAQGNVPDAHPTGRAVAHRRAFFPGERVRLAFKLPPGAKLDAPLEAQVTLLLSDLDGRALQTLSPVTLKASSDSAEGGVDWTVADVPE